MNEIKTLINLLTDLRLPFTFCNLFGGCQVILLDAEGNKLDDAVWHQYSHGYAEGLLETYRLNDCEGYEEAIVVAHGWYDMFYKQGRFAE